MSELSETVKNYINDDLTDVDDSLNIGDISSAENDVLDVRKMLKDTDFIGSNWAFDLYNSIEGIKFIIKSTKDGGGKLDNSGYNEAHDDLHDKIVKLAKRENICLCD